MARGRKKAGNAPDPPDSPAAPPEFPAEALGGLSPRDWRTIVLRAAYRGPWPAAEEFQRYNEILPGAAERIVAAWEREQAHRQQCEREVIAMERRLGSRGQQFALAVALAGLSAAVACAYLGQPWPASVIGGGTLAALVYAFVTGRRERFSLGGEPRAKEVQRPE
jgi:uncharacterized membrane protein